MLSCHLFVSLLSFYRPKRNTLNEEYRSLSETEKEKYTDLAKEDKLQQDKAIAEYEAELPEDDDDGTTAAKPKKKKKDANAPKHPKNAFLFFSKENRQAIKDANPTATFGEVVSVAMRCVRRCQ